MPSLSPREQEVYDQMPEGKWVSAHELNTTEVLMKRLRRHGLARRRITERGKGEGMTLWSASQFLRVSQ